MLADAERIKKPQEQSVHEKRQHQAANEKRAVNKNQVLRVREVHQGMLCASGLFVLIIIIILILKLIKIKIKIRIRFVESSAFEV